MFRAENAPDLGFYWGEKCPLLKARKEGYHRTGYPIFLELILEMYLRKKQKRNYIYMAG